jgi:hypothetical protein
MSLAVPVTPGLFEWRCTSCLNQKDQNGRGNNLQILLFYLFYEPRANLTALIQARPRIDKPNFINVWHQTAKAAI